MQWVVTVAYETGLNLFKRFFHMPDAKGLDTLQNSVWRILKENGAITIVEEPS